jgi:mRNA-degrading endonuclease RelE of RelBE toxin-antitoxin system
MIRTQILLTPTLRENLKILAKKEGRSVSSLIRELLEKAIDIRTGKRKKISAEFLMKLAKKPIDGPPDLGSNDDYLYKT